MTRITYRQAEKNLADIGVSGKTADMILETLGFESSEYEKLYDEHFDAKWGTISLLERSDRLELWVGGKWRFQLEDKDV